MTKNKEINFDFENNCYGCRNCENICPKKAIKMINNEEGFIVPKIDYEKCIDCGLCTKNVHIYIIIKNINEKKMVWRIFEKMKKKGCKVHQEECLQH